MIIGKFSSTLSMFLRLTNPIVNDWMARIYAFVPIISIFDCAVECVTDFNCQLYAVEDGMCLLGNGIVFNSSMPVAKNPSEGIFVATGFANEAGPMELLNVTSSFWMDHIYYFSTCDLKDRCELWCFLERSPCQYVVFNGSICFMGSTERESLLVKNISTVPQQNVWLTKKGIENTDYKLTFEGNINTTKYASFVFKSYSAEDFLQSCEFFCAFQMDPVCHFFFRNGDICYFGNMDKTLPSIMNSTIRETITLYIQSLLPYLKTLFKPRLTSDWASQMYKKILLTYPSPQNDNECLLRCHFDDGPCHSFVVQENDCYLGDPFVNSSLFVGTRETVIMEKNPQLHVNHGGSKGNGDEKTSSIFQGYHGQCGHSLLDLPYPLRAMGYAYGEDSIFVCGGISDVGGGEQDKCYQWRFKVFPRAWIPLPAMMNNQMMFPMFYHQGKLYAAGGRSSGSTIRNMRVLNLESDSWTNGAAYLESGFYAHCGILHQDRIYSFGGSRNALLYSKAVQIYDITTDSWASSSFDLPQGLRQMACGLVPGDGDWIPDLFLLAGGEIGPGEYSNKVYSIDPTSNGEVVEMLQLSMSVSRFGSQNCFAVFHENVVFLAIGYGNGTHKTDTVLKWDRWVPSLNPYSTKLPGLEQPGNAMIPLRNLPVCTDQSLLWKSIVNQVKPARFPVEGWNENFEDSQHTMYSQFQLIEQNSCEGKYHFRLIYPELGTYNEWYQTNDPSNASHMSVTGFEGLALGMPIGFHGLLYNNIDALAMGDSNATHPQWFSVGRIKMDTVSGEFPGPQNTFVSKVQLFIKNDCATT
ncbi:uncharacterized protein LOC131886331 isoform X1 [Tigriopus californicus]|uniref:uncharacterized protein LOC131886331 isoform X1 n=1 Tax=Tigriopus californicus TaxID=6832 RepID=UPI0027DA8F36|nr:uncharacterized protein LOC131886331 isoform X1 [Tigriopus californicus]